MKKRIKITSLIILKTICLISLCTFPMLSYWGKSMAKEINHDSIMNQFSFFPTEDKFVLEIEGEEVTYHVYDMGDQMCLKEPFLVDEKINSVDELIKVSENVAIVTMKEYELTGEGLLARFDVNKVIKSEKVKEGDQIQIYDMITNIWSLLDSDHRNNKIAEAGYVYGNLPLAENERYLVFFKDAPNPIKAGAYMYTSLRYGNFRITEYPVWESEFNFVVNERTNERKTLKEMSQYDVVYYEGKDIDIKELSLYKEVYEKYKEYSLE